VTSAALRAVQIAGLPLFRSGKVRETYELGDALLMVATDRISAFDVVAEQGVPNKGRVLTQLSAFWFARTQALVPNHLLSTSVDDLPSELAPQREALRGRCMLVRRAERVDIECVARGYLSGSAWVEYQRAGTVCGQPLPAGLRESDELPEPLFTPARKADTGHDENISLAEMHAAVGDELTHRLQALTLRIYGAARDAARLRGIIIADTKFEFGFIDGELTLIDELLTPDSSRFWDVATYAPGGPQASFDKQPVRDWLLARGWDRNPPMPTLPDEIIAQTSERYRTAYTRLTGTELEDA
jgi:phosphoribosylaminoimidazole-succinocarboxamide synthase